MFSRKTIHHIAWVALIVVWVAVLAPRSTFAVDGMAMAPGTLDLCTVDGKKPGSDAPDFVAHKPCVFCTSSVAVFADANSPRLIGLIEGVPFVMGPPPRDHALPPDIAATHPMSPRAPPRFS